MENDIDLSSDMSCMSLTNADKYITILQQNLNNDQQQVINNTLAKFDEYKSDGCFQQAINVISKLVEDDIDNDKKYRALTWKLHSCNDVNTKQITGYLYSKLTEMRQEQPLVFWDLGVFLSSSDYVEAGKNLIKILTDAWDARFAHSISMIALNDYLALRQKLIRTDKYKQLVELDHWVKEHNAHLSSISSRQVNYDIRVVITWNCPLSNVELHIVEPTGEICQPLKNNTMSGGVLSDDVKGYGPVEYTIAEAPRGTYTVKTKLFHSIPEKLERPIIVHVHVFTNFGGEKENYENTTVYLCHSKHEVDVANIIIQ
mmetsp:Transcript_8226/g.9138  ORF Transcript_8226/g.9138 Transcript_8226/m.9138 type:complete len:315 (-) Transcript_8226:21-965(-)